MIERLCPLCRFPEGQRLKKCACNNYSVTKEED